MGKKESTFINMVLVLFVITAVASLALGGIYNLTKEPIALAKKAKRERAIKEVIPDFDTLISYKVMPATGKDSVTISLGYKNDSLMGTAIASYSNNGYDPTQIQLMVGFLPNGIIKNTSVTQQKETPGLGVKIKDAKFKDQFMGINPAEFNLTVTKDGGDIDAITAATITSRAFCEAVQQANDVYQKEGGNK